MKDETSRFLELLLDVESLVLDVVALDLEVNQMVLGQEVLLFHVLVGYRTLFDLAVQDLNQSATNLEVTKSLNLRDLVTAQIESLVELLQGV